MLWVALSSATLWQFYGLQLAFVRTKFPQKLWIRRITNRYLYLSTWVLDIYISCHLARVQFKLLNDNISNFSFLKDGQSLKIIEIERVSSHGGFVWLFTTQIQVETANHTVDRIPLEAWTNLYGQIYQLIKSESNL